MTAEKLRAQIVSVRQKMERLEYELEAATEEERVLLVQLAQILDQMRSIA